MRSPPDHPLVLAYLGDAVYELAIRERLIRSGGCSPRELHRVAAARVSAAAQAAAWRAIAPSLRPDEAEAARRARNHRGGSRPRGVPASMYQEATELEAVFGYLHLSGDRARIGELLDRIAATWTEPTPTAAPPCR